MGEYSSDSWGVWGLPVAAEVCGKLLQTEVVHAPPQGSCPQTESLGRARLLGLPGSCGQWPVLVHRLVAAATFGVGTTSVFCPMPLVLTQALVVASSISISGVAVHSQGLYYLWHA